MVALVFVFMERSWGQKPGGGSHFCLHGAVIGTETGWWLSFLSSWSGHEDRNWVVALILVFMERS